MPLLTIQTRQKIGPQRCQHAHKPSPASAATTGYAAELWKMADALRGSTDAAEYKHVVNRQGLVDSEMVDCMVALPGQLERNLRQHSMETSA